MRCQCPSGKASTHGRKSCMRGQRRCGSACTWGRSHSTPTHTSHTQSGALAWEDNQPHSCPGKSRTCRDTRGTKTVWRKRHHRHGIHRGIHFASTEKIILCIRFCMSGSKGGHRRTRASIPCWNWRIRAGSCRYHGFQRSCSNTFSGRPARHWRKGEESRWKKG